MTFGATRAVSIGKSNVPAVLWVLRDCTASKASVVDVKFTATPPMVKVEVTLALPVPALVWRTQTVALLAIVAAAVVKVAVQPIDFRGGIDALAAVCRQRLGSDPLSGALFVFCNRARTR